ncbi:MAG: hypothetical protein Q9174_003839 [Haloplaca sp. 1 TL-2023]
MTRRSSKATAIIDLTPEGLPQAYLASGPSSNVQSDASSSLGEAAKMGSIIDLEMPIEECASFQPDDFISDDEFQAALSSKEGIWSHSSVYQTAQQTPSIAIDTYSADGRTFKRGKTVELHDGDFLRILTVLQDQQTRTVFLKGHRLQRLSKHYGLFDQHLNELVMVLSEDSNITNNEDKNTYTVPVSEVVTIREMVMTNTPYPKFGCREDVNNRGRPRDFIRQYCRVVCRWKILVSYKPHATRGQVRVGECILRVMANEADFNFHITDQQSRVDWRGVTLKGGSCSHWFHGEKDFDRAEHARVQSFRGQTLNAPLSFPRQRYTFGDAFCGGGGASRGAKAAGFRVEWGFDFDPAAIESYAKNFFAARCEAMPADVFISSINEDFRVDVLHISPCCQPYSPLHTRPGANDERNQATMFAVGELLRKTQPRIVVLENTSGLVERHEDWLHAMVQTFTSLGFSIRWRVINLAEYGLAQARRRLIVLASW